MSIGIFVFRDHNPTVVESSSDITQSAHLSFEDESSMPPQAQPSPVHAGIIPQTTSLASSRQLLSDQVQNLIDDINDKRKEDARMIEEFKTSLYVMESGFFMFNIIQLLSYATRFATIQYI